MEDSNSQAKYDPLFVRNMIESALRISLVALLLILSYEIISPFTVPILWGAIIAMAAFPLVTWLEPKLGGRRGLSSALVSISIILIMVIPAWSVTEATLGGIRHLSSVLESGGLKIPPPSPNVATWPVVGERLFTAWTNASRDMQAFAHEHSNQIAELAKALLERVGSSVLGVLMFVLSIIIAGVFMTYAESCSEATRRFFIRIGGLKPGGEWAPLAVATVRNVLQGVVGVALIQTTLISIGLFVAGIPGAALWSTIILVLAIAQLPALLVVAPIMVYVWSTADTTTAIIFTVYQVLAGASDNVLKPMLMGRGLGVPMPVILVGAIGGMLLYGIIGLFVGSVILSFFYKLLGLWLAQEAQ